VQFVSGNRGHGLMMGLRLGSALVGFLVPAVPGQAFAANADCPKGLDAFSLESAPQAFVPAVPRTEADQRRLEALALFATARSAEQQGKDDAALRLYQRALRYDPESASIARAIVPLAFRLKRPAEAVRYALRAVELEEADPILLRRLGIYLAEQGDWEQAIKLLERALQSRAGSQETAADILLRMELGRLCHLMERYDQAADYFARVLHALEHPKDFAIDEETARLLLGDPSPTYGLFADCFRLAGRLKAARAAYQKADEADPNPGRLHINLARVFLQAGQPEKALRAVEAAFEHDLGSENVGPYRVLLEVLDRLNRKDEKLARLQQLQKKQKNTPAVRQVLADQYRECGKLEEAAILYEELLEESPALAIFRDLTNVYRQSGRVECLLRVAGKLAEKTGAIDALDMEVSALAKDETTLERLLEAARRRNRENDEGLQYGPALAAALLALEGDRFEAAAEFFERTLARRPERAAELLMTWGLGLLLRDKPGRAAGVFRRAVDQNVQPKNNAVFHYYLAGALELDGLTDEALKAARRAAELAPDSPRFHERAAWILYHAGRHGEAIKAYRCLIEQFDGDYGSTATRDLLRQARLILSNLYVLEGDYAGAEPWLEEVLDEFPGDPGALNDLGYLWADQEKNLELAVEMIERAVAAQPDNAAFRDSLGWVYYRLGRYEEAVLELEKAAGSGDEPDPIILDHLGDAYRAANRIDEAKETWRRAAKAFRNANDSEKAIAVEKKLTVEGS